ncbi:two-component system sensor histidine kinase CreC [Undibacterium terreum]|uniref:histidine kinase n=1 Tax=Undibacterium terreum TaxID=1224302 RepID=A0A916U2R8_9BURK|nr:two-component system sensor histidine kinase CreC [Undibacterium terreum]GGC58468.1 two-component sensor histidine kinase [Undibacterium terreum]
MKLGLRVFLGYFLIVGLAALVVQQVFLKEVKPAVRQAMESTLVDTANILAELAVPDMKNNTIANGEFAAHIKGYSQRGIDASIWGLRKNSMDYRVYITDKSGKVVFDSAGQDLGKDYSRWNDVYQTLHGKYGARSTKINANDDSSSVMHVAAAIRDGDQLIGVLTVAKPNSSLQPALDKSERIILRWSVGLIVISLLVGGGMTWWVSNTLGHLQSYARAVTAGERAEPPKRGPQEVVELGRQLEGMRQQLEGKQYVENTMHTLTHELKSPLAAIRGAAELLTDESKESVPASVQQRFLKNIQEQSLRLSELVEKMLALAALENRQFVEHPEPVDIQAMLAEVAGLLEQRANQAGVSLDLQLPDKAIHIMGDKFLLKQACANLLENAISFSAPDSHIELGLQLSENILQIRIRDFGSGIPEYAMPRLFERFYSLPRPDGQAKSTGLGLCFVREIAHLHRGQIRLSNNMKGGGVTATLALPAKS